jgi:hypothetical protein
MAFATILPFRVIAKQICDASFLLYGNTTSTIPTAAGQLAKFLQQIGASILVFDLAMKF